MAALLSASPAGAHFQTSIAHIWKHITPLADKRYVKKSEVRTITGTYFIEATGAAGSAVASDSISFGRTLKTAPTAHFIKVDDTPPAACPGTVTAPRARAGHLCVYESRMANVASNRGIWNPTGTGGFTSTRMGTGVYAYSNAAGQFWSHGTWAVTIP